MKAFFKIQSKSNKKGVLRNRTRSNGLPELHLAILVMHIVSDSDED